MVSPWVYKSATFSEKDIGFSIDFSGECFAIFYNQHGELTGCLNGNANPHEDQCSEVLSTSEFGLFPSEFIGVNMEGLQWNLKADLGHDISICFAGKRGNYHWMQILLKNALNIAERKSNLVYFWFHRKELYVIVVKNKVVYLANRYRVESPSEVLYFIAACIQDSKMESLDFQIVADSNDRDLEALLYEGDRIGMEIVGITHSIPQLGPYVSQKHIVGNLVLVTRCELPVEI